MELIRRTDIEAELSKLGWTSDDYPGANNIKVFQSYNTSKKVNPEKPWEIVVYCKLPVWEWDFVQRWSRNGFLNIQDYNPDSEGYLINVRYDFEFSGKPWSKQTALAMHEERNYEFDNDSFRMPYQFSHAAVQRVSDRP